MQTRLLSRILIVGALVMGFGAMADNTPPAPGAAATPQIPPAPSAAATPQVPPAPSPAPPTPAAPYVQPPSPAEQPMPIASPEPPAGLEDFIAKATTSSPEVEVAEAQLREAEAKLRQARLAAAQQAAELFQHRVQAQQVVDAVRKNLDEVKKVVDLEKAPTQALIEPQQSLARAQVEVAKYDALFRMQSDAGARTGGYGQAAGSLVGPAEPRMPQPRPKLETAPEQLRQLLDAPVSIDFKAQPLADVTSLLHDTYNINLVLDSIIEPKAYPVTISVSETPLKNILLALADRFGDLCFLVRDYGLFITTREHAQTIAAPSIPENIPLFVPIGAMSGGTFSVSGSGGGFGGGGVVGGGFGGGVSSSGGGGATGTVVKEAPTPKAAQP